MWAWRNTILCGHLSWFCAEEARTAWGGANIRSNCTNANVTLEHFTLFRSRFLTFYLSETPILYALSSVSRHHILVIICILLDFTMQSQEYVSQQAVAGERRAPGGQLVVRTTCYLELWVGRWCAQQQYCSSTLQLRYRRPAPYCSGTVCPADTAMPYTPTSINYKQIDQGLLLHLWRMSGHGWPQLVPFT